MTSSYSDLGLDPTSVRDTLDALGIDDTYSDAQLESLRFVSNLVLTNAIDEKSIDIEDYLASYQAETDKLSAMQEVLNDVRDYLSSGDAKLSDVIDFMEAEHVFIDGLDPSSVSMDFEIQYTSNSGEPATKSFSNLQDLVDIMVSGEFGVVNGAKLLDSNNWYDVAGGDSKIVVRDYSGTNNVGYKVYVDLVDSWSYQDPSGAVSSESFAEFVIANAMQKAGLIDENVPIYLLSYVDTFYRDDNGEFEGARDFSQLYYGKVSIDIDETTGAITATYNTASALAEMGIDLAEYSGSFDNSMSGFPTPLSLADDSPFLRTIGYYTFGNREDFWEFGGIDSYSSSPWSNYANDSRSENFADDDIDILLEAIATAVESQSTDTEVSLLYTNNAITQWGEFNDVWDMVHQYVHDALKRASDNAV
ncbi:hypothetical protein AB1K70_03395 [Bremerella sp. JC770]|uniref:hypothetical protein n=1 Tax=Bremerella sp. JC770 TaxID=3232137 RepID=UPI00345AEBF8